MCLLPRPDAPIFLTSSCSVAHYLSDQFSNLKGSLSVDLGCFWLHPSEYMSKTTNLCIPMVRHMGKNHCPQRRKRFFPRVKCNGAIFWDCSTGGRPEVSWGIDFVVCQQALLYVLCLLQYISRCEMYVSEFQKMLMVYLKFFLCYTVLFPFWNFRPRLAWELLVYVKSCVYICIHIFVHMQTFDCTIASTQYWREW